MKHVEIEATNLCNAVCVMCPRDKLSRARGHMSWETYQTVIDKLLAFGQTETISFSGIGEPILNPLLDRFVAYASPHFRTALTSNGSRLSKAAISGLLDAGLDTLILSFNGADAETYEQIMVPLRFDQAQEAIRRLTSMAGDRLELYANVTVSNLTKRQLPAIKDLLNREGIDKIIYSHCHGRAGYLTDETICSMPRPPATTRCDLLAGTTFVAWNGLVLSCCHDLAGAAVLGDLSQMSMVELAAKRDQILREGVHFPMCADCDDLWRLGHDQPPPGASLNEWVYRLYESEDSRTAALTEALRLRDRQVAEVQAQTAALASENARLRETVEGYESGRFIRFTRWLHQQRKRLGR